MRRKIINSMVALVLGILAIPLAMVALPIAFAMFIFNETSAREEK